ncbi:uncharacterized protein ARMOST_14313 [Armillaria ostoyae]|uniref:Uncharacterized protein n=1 Tax=Armillaria ostoyae TaxID=47428 RepID=A0A284RQ67_ARMOS|nr:uncharacterized protein ARMOST_14313 [Armillaria ostoyae]
MSRERVPPQGFPEDDSLAPAASFSSTELLGTSGHSDEERQEWGVGFSGWGSSSSSNGVKRRDVFPERPLTHTGKSSKAPLYPPLNATQTCSDATWLVRLEHHMFTVFFRAYTATEGDADFVRV